MQNRVFAILAVSAMLLAGCICGDFPPAIGRAESSAVPLRGTAWTLVDTFGSNVNPDSVKAIPYIEFGNDGRLNGMAGCNRVFGVYDSDAGELSFSGLGTTKMFCPTGMSTEARLLDALNRTKRFNWVADTLQLWDDLPAQLARFQRRESDP